MQVQHVTVIAEAGVNHNGSLDLALRLVDAAAAAGADVVKFQTFKAEKLVSRRARKADYQVRATGDAEGQLEMLQRLELSDEAHDAVVERCRKKGVRFMSTPFDVDSLDLLVRNFDMDCVKVGSGELTNAILLLAAARTGRPVILSSGMATLSDVEAALGVLAFGYSTPAGTEAGREAFARAYASAEGQVALRENVTLLHCTTEYPAPFDSVNLRAMDTLSAAFGLPVGYSDHTEGLAVPVAAVARGAVVIEKHLTLDRTMDGPDHAASLEPDDFAAMVLAIRQIEIALGDGRKTPAPSEMKNRDIARKSLVAARDIAAGEIFSADNLTVQRPGDGLSPFAYWDLLGKPASRAFAAEEPVS